MYREIIECILFTIIALYVRPVCSEMEYFPGLRRPPNWSQSQADEATDLLAQIIEEQARRRFQQQLAQQHYYQFHYQQRGPNANSVSAATSKPSFTYNFPENINNNINRQSGDNKNINEIQFAVNPSDPRYYDESLSSINSNLNSKYDNHKSNADTEKNMNIKINNNGNVPYSRLKPPMEINPKTPLTSIDNKNNNLNGHHDINTLVDKLEHEGQLNAIINDGNLIHHKNDVTKKHMGIEGEMGMYIVALIAGVSAAVTVGIIALGIGWYTLQKRTKAASDVDYPAYGVTGPSKDISPSGDRRLAQSAQMYHYQHQKQQIIAMENRTTGDNNGISDVDSDDDNDEGDYTVYECPGLAPTGEMEVKNPLFLDDTPVTPADGQVQIQQQQIQPQQQQQPQKQQVQQLRQQTFTTQSNKQNSKKSSSNKSLSSTQQQQQQQQIDDKKKSTGK